jgi:hypothetical protein
MSELSHNISLYANVGLFDQRTATGMIQAIQNSLDTVETWRDQSKQDDRVEPSERAKSARDKWLAKNTGFARRMTDPLTGDWQ